MTDLLAKLDDIPDARRDYAPTRYDLAFRTAGLAACVNEAHRETQWFINDIANRQHYRRRWLTLYGPSGSGKTHLASAASRVLRELGFRAQKWRWGRALSMMLEGEWQLMRQLIDMPVLVLDDVGAEYLGRDNIKQLNAAKLLELLEARLDRWTFITTNLRPSQIGEVLDTRIASRLYRGNNVLVDMTGAADYGLATYRNRREGRITTPQDLDQRT